MWRGIYKIPPSTLGAHCPHWGQLFHFQLHPMCLMLLQLFWVRVQAILRVCDAVVVPEGFVQLVQFRHQGQTNVQLHL